MSLVAEEILAQPSAWSRAVDLARSAPRRLPAGERIAVTGCGSSWHAAKTLAALRERSGQGETDAFAASEALLVRDYDRVVAISRSGDDDRDPARVGAVGAETRRPLPWSATR